MVTFLTSNVWFTKSAQKYSFFVFNPWKVTLTAFIYAGTSDAQDRGRIFLTIGKIGEEINYFHSSCHSGHLSSRDLKYELCLKTSLRALCTKQLSA